MKIADTIFTCLACGFFSCCQPPERFEFFELGELAENGTYSEFIVPNHEGDLVSISGMLDPNKVNYQKFMGTFRFDIQCYLQDGRVRKFENLVPREASWHGADRSFVIFSKIDASRDGKIVKLMIRGLRANSVEGSVDEKITLKLYTGRIVTAKE